MRPWHVQMGRIRSLALTRRSDAEVDGIDSPRGPEDSAELGVWASSSTREQTRTFPIEFNSSSSPVME